MLQATIICNLFRKGFYTYVHYWTFSTSGFFLVKETNYQYLCLYPNCDFDQTGFAPKCLDHPNCRLQWFSCRRGNSNFGEPLFWTPWPSAALQSSVKEMQKVHRRSCCLAQTPRRGAVSCSRVNANELTSSQALTASRLLLYCPVRKLSRCLKAQCLRLLRGLARENIFFFIKIHQREEWSVLVFLFFISKSCSYYCDNEYHHIVEKNIKLILLWYCEYGFPGPGTAWPPCWAPEGTSRISVSSPVSRGQMSAREILPQNQ